MTATATDLDLTPEQVDHLARLNAWRALPAEEQARRMAERAAGPQPLGRDFETAVLAELCPAGSGPCGCGAEPRICGDPGRPLAVWKRDCLPCQARRAWEAGAEAGW